MYVRSVSSGIAKNMQNAGVRLYPEPLPYTGRTIHSREMDTLATVRATSTERMGAEGLGRGADPNDPDILFSEFMRQHDAAHAPHVGGQFGGTTPGERTSNSTPSAPARPSGNEEYDDGYVEFNRGNRMVAHLEGDIESGATSPSSVNQVRLDLNESFDRAVPRGGELLLAVPAVGQ